MSQRVRRARHAVPVRNGERSFAGTEGEGFAGLAMMESRDTTMDTCNATNKVLGMNNKA